MPATSKRKEERMTAATFFEQITAAELTDITNAVNRFNETRTKEQGYYAISIATPFRRHHALWRIFTDNTPPLFIRTLSESFSAAVKQAMLILRHNRVALTWRDNEFFVPYYGSNADIVTFGKYRGKRLAEIYYIDPSYVLWMANRFEPEKKKLQQTVEIARAFARIHAELIPPRPTQNRTVSEYVGQKGDKLSALHLRIISVKRQVDTYKPDFYIDQRVLATDEKGNRFCFTEHAGGRSQTPNALSCHSRAMVVGTDLLLSSAKVLGHYESFGTKYTRIGYIKYAQEP